MTEGDNQTEIPVEADRLEYLLTARGDHAAQVGERRFSEHDVERLRPHIQRVAAQVLSDKQLSTWLAHAIEGESVKDIARRLGISHAAIHYRLFGQKDHGEGAMGRMARALAEDAGFQSEIAAIEAENAPHSENDRSLYSRWWTNHLAPGTGPNWFVSLAVLLVLHTHRDGKDEVPLNTLIAHVPRAVVDPSIRQLRYGQFIQFDGTNIKILKTPVEVQHG